MVEVKFRFWNIRGLANQKSANMLTRLIKQQHPQIVFIVEPMLAFSSSIEAFLKGLNPSLIAKTNGNQKHARLWCLAPPNTIIMVFIHTQFITLFGSMQGNFHFAGVYGANSHTERTFMG